MKFIIRDRECGNQIDERYSYAEALQLINDYETEDKKNGCYSDDFYEIVTEENNP